ncbi:hypothetical protein [Streptomyces sp. NPDC058084]|uniref:hypothetical protein n=1 Tax=Streptomyces sp. NPDC058084 TaxID=3346333 RepID=UPI0036EAE770
MALEARQQPAQKQRVGARDVEGEVCLVVRPAFVGGDAEQARTRRHGQGEHLDHPVFAVGALDGGPENPYVKIRGVAVMTCGKAVANDDAGLRRDIGRQPARSELPAQGVLVRREHEHGGVSEPAPVGQRPQFGAVETGQHAREQDGGVLFTDEAGCRPESFRVVDGARRRRGRGHGEGRGVVAVHGLSVSAGGDPGRHLERAVRGHG